MSTISPIPNRQRWQVGGYNYYVADDGSLSFGRPGDTPQPLSNNSLPLTGGTISGGLSVTGLSQLAALRLNGTAVIASTTAPATRTDGTALVAGDFWLNPSTGTIGFWRSPYWLSTAVTTIDFPSTGAISGSAVSSGMAYAPYGLYWESFTGVVRLTTGGPATLGLVEIHGRATSTGGNVQATIFSGDMGLTNIFPGNGPTGNFSGTINTAVIVPVNSSASILSYTFSATGTAINVGVQLSARARLIL